MGKLEELRDRNQQKVEEIKKCRGYQVPQEEVDILVELVWSALLDRVLQNEYKTDIEDLFRTLKQVLRMYGPTEVVEHPIKWRNLVSDVYQRTVDYGVAQQKALVEFRPASLGNMLWWKDEYGIVKESGLIFLLGSGVFIWVDKGDQVPYQNVRKP